MIYLRDNGSYEAQDLTKGLVTSEEDSPITTGVSVA
jgi:hypothetical protein